MKKEWVTDKWLKPETNNDIYVDSDIFTTIFVMIVLSFIIYLLHSVVGICFFVFFAVMLSLRLHSYYYYKNKVKARKNKYEKNEMNDEEKAKYEEDLEAYNSGVKKINELEEAKQVYNIKDHQIDYTIVVTTDSRKSATSTAMRGAVGGALFGAAGLVGGAASGKNKQTTTFKIVYKSGRVEVKTVKNDSAEFEELASLVR